MATVVVVQTAINMRSCELQHQQQSQINKKVVAAILKLSSTHGRFCAGNKNKDPLIITQPQHALTMNTTEMEERIRFKVETGSSYGSLPTQIRWLDRKLRVWVGGVSGFVDLDSFVDCMLSDLTLVGCREVVVELFNKYKELDGVECDLLDTEKFATALMNTSILKQKDEMRRSVGAIY